MSEIRSHATPAREELAETVRIEVFEAVVSISDGYHPRSEDDHAIIHKAAETIMSAIAPRVVNSATDLKALPTCSLIRGLEREGQRSGDVFEKVGPDHWLCLDPGDRFDGEETTPSHAIVLIYKAGIRVLFTPGEAG